MGGVYLYGFIEMGYTATVAALGVEAASPVYTITQDRLACVVSDYGEDEFRPVPREQMVRGLLAHQRVVEHVMQDRAVLPVRFGTVLRDAREVQALLAQGHVPLARALADILGKVEIEVAATWDTGRVLRDVAAEVEVARAREAILRAGEPSLEQRVHLGQLAQAYLDRRRRSYQERITAFLRPLSLDAVPNALVSDSLVTNVAFLVARDQQQRFHEGVRRLDGLLRNEIAFRVIGPLPPYTFSTIQVTRVTPEQVEEARAALRLGGPLSEARVRRAYRHLAAEEQRRQAGESMAGGHTSRLRWASQVLLRYCRALAEVRSGETSQAGAHQQGGCLFAVTVQGPRSNEVEAARFGAVAGV